MIKECKMELKEGLYIDNKYYDKGTHTGLKLNLTEIQQVMYSGYGNRVYEKIAADPEQYVELTKSNFNKEIAPMKDLGESTPPSEPEPPAGGDGGEEGGGGTGGGQDGGSGESEVTTPEGQTNEISAALARSSSKKRR